MAPILDERAPGPSDGTIAGAAIATRVKARFLAGLFAAGATLALLTVLLPHPAQANELWLLLIPANAFLVAGLVYWRAANLPDWALQVAGGWGTALITSVAYFSAESPSPLIFFYLWIFLYSSYFFTQRETVLQIAWVGILYGVLLAARPPEAGVAPWWFVGMGALLVAAILIRSMRGRVEHLIAQLYESARIDPLTRLPNRRGFRELLDLELERGHRSELSLSVLVGDIDFFKDVNDRLGHPSGDIVLQRLARVLESTKRRIDSAARVGGEEFALILPDTDTEDAFALAERLRTTVEDAFAADTVPITISFGIAVYPRDGEMAGAILRAGDDALYAAKEAGRNRTVIHDPDLGERVHRGAKRDIGGERYLAILLELAEAVDLRFSGSARHSETVGRYAEMMADELGFSERQVKRVKLAGILHDIGKVSVPDAVLRKPGALDDEEWEMLHKHPELGAQILEHPDLADVRSWVGAHHERPDGKGYPNGLAGPEITLEARILAVADAYEAMTSDRPYRSSLGHTAARAELRRCSGTQFDPRVVEALLGVLDRDLDPAPALAPAG